MENKKGLNFVLVVVAIILGVTLIKKFDFREFKFENTGLAIVYIIAFAGSVYFLSKDRSR